MRWVLLLSPQLVGRGTDIEFQLAFPKLKIILLKKWHESCSNNWATPIWETAKDAVCLLHKDKWNIFQVKIFSFTMALSISGHLVTSYLQLLCAFILFTPKDYNNYYIIIATTYYHVSDIMLSTLYSVFHLICSKALNIDIIIPLL